MPGHGSGTQGVAIPKSGVTSSIVCYMDLGAVGKESDGCEPKAVKASPVEYTQIHLTQDSSITQEELDDAAFRLLVTGRYREFWDRDAKFEKITLPSAAFIRPHGHE